MRSGFCSDSRSVLLSMAPRFWEMQLQKKEERLARSVRQVGTLTSGAAGTRLSQITNDSNQGANARSRNPSPNAGMVHNANDEGQLTSKRKFMDENTGNSFGNVSLGILSNVEGSRTNPINLDSENGSNTSGSLTILNQESYERNNMRNVRSRPSSSGHPAANGIPIEMGFAVLAEDVRQLVILSYATAMDGRICSHFFTSFCDDPWPMPPVSGINGQRSNNASFNNHQSLLISDDGPSCHCHPITVSGINPVRLPAFSHLPLPASAVHDQVSHLFNHFEHEETWPMLMTSPVSSGTNVQGITHRRGDVSRQGSGRGSGTVNFSQSPAAAGNNQNISEEMGMLEYSSEVDFETEDDALRDMRLDVDNMSYEELLDLGEQIGNVNIGLTEKAAKKRMKLRKFVPKKKQTEPCCICQDEYKKGDKLGILKTCGHTFHPDCIKQWLMVKDSCPICKTATSGASK